MAVRRDGTTDNGRREVDIRCRRWRSRMGTRRRIERLHGIAAGQRVVQHDRVVSALAARTPRRVVYGPPYRHGWSAATERRDDTAVARTGQGPPRGLHAHVEVGVGTNAHPVDRDSAATVHGGGQPIVVAGVHSLRFGP